MSYERSDLREYVAALGGDEAVCAELGVALKTLLYCYDKRRFTAAWYGPFRELARERGIEPPPVGMFGWAERRAAERQAAGPAPRREDRAA